MTFGYLAAKKIAEQARTETAAFMPNKQD